MPSNSLNSDDAVYQPLLVHLKTSWNEWSECIQLNPHQGLQQEWQSQLQWLPSALAVGDTPWTQEGWLFRTTSDDIWQLSSGSLIEAVTQTMKESYRFENYMIKQCTQIPHLESWKTLWAGLSKRAQRVWFFQWVDEAENHQSQAPKDGSEVEKQAWQAWVLECLREQSHHLPGWWSGRVNGIIKAGRFSVEDSRWVEALGWKNPRWWAVSLGLSPDIQAKGPQVSMEDSVTQEHIQGLEVLLRNPTTLLSESPKEEPAPPDSSLGLPFWQWSLEQWSSEDQEEKRFKPNLKEIWFQEHHAAWFDRLCASDHPQKLTWAKAWWNHFFNIYHRHDSIDPSWLLKMAFEDPTGECFEAFKEMDEGGVLRIRVAPCEGEVRDPREKDRWNRLMSMPDHPIHQWVREKISTGELVLVNMDQHQPIKDHPLWTWRHALEWDDEEQTALLNVELCSQRSVWAQKGLERSAFYWLEQPLEKAWEPLLNKIKIYATANWKTFFYQWSQILHRANEKEIEQTLQPALEWLQALSNFANMEMDKETVLYCFDKMNPRDQAFVLTKKEVLIDQMTRDYTGRFKEVLEAFFIELQAHYLSTALASAQAPVKPKARL